MIFANERFSTMLNISLKYKRWVAICLLTLLSWQIVFQFSYIVYWKINQKAITNLFCENKDKPMLHCDGNCYLKKQLEKAESNKNKLPPVLKKLRFETETTLEDYFVFEKNPQNVIGNSSEKLPFNSFIFLPKSCRNQVFHPPCDIV